MGRDIFLISPAALLTAILTFFSWVGLGAFVTQVFMVFFPEGFAITLTGVVYFFNNLLKLFLAGKNADKEVLNRFGIPAVIAAFWGSWLLLHITGLQPLFSFSLFGKTFLVYPF